MSAVRAMPATVLAIALVASPALARGPVHIVVDPGHGGDQTGAAGPGGLWEKSLCLELAQKLAAALQTGLGAHVALTRASDVDLPLPERVKIANREHADLFISLHANSMPTRRLRAKIEGIETLFLSASASDEEARKTAERENGAAELPQQGASGDALGFILADLKRTDALASSSRLAYAIHQRVISATGAKDRGVQQAPLYVLMGVEAPAVLLEVGFVSHPEEARRLRSRAYQDKLVRAVVAGVRAFLAQVQPKDAPGPAVALPAER